MGTKFKDDNSLKTFKNPHPKVVKKRFVTTSFEQ
jgi:hypothetical protein